MLVKFREKEEHDILFTKEYSDILPLLEMVKQKGAFSIFFDPEGDKRIIGRLYDYEYIIEFNESNEIESLVVSIDCVDKEL